MILADTSAWVEYLRATGTVVDHRITELIATSTPFATTDVVVMETLAGGRDARHVARLRQLLLECRYVAVDGLADFEQAAGVFRACRQNGETVRNLTDCLVAAVAIRVGLELLHRDRDFDVIARHTELRVVAP